MLVFFLQNIICLRSQHSGKHRHSLAKNRSNTRNNRSVPWARLPDSVRLVNNGEEVCYLIVASVSGK
jgi:hypothetical protein